jgi:hypothetical protein
MERLGAGELGITGDGIHDVAYATLPCLSSYPPSYLPSYPPSCPPSPPASVIDGAHRLPVLCIAAALSPSGDVRVPLS